MRTPIRLRTSLRRRPAALVLPGVLLAAGLQLGAGPAAQATSPADAASAGRAAPEGKLRLAGTGETAVPDSWIVVLKGPAGATSAAASSGATATAPASSGAAPSTAPADVPAVARDLVARADGARVGHVYRAALHGFSARMSQAQAARTAADSRVAYVRQDTRVRIAETPTRPAPKPLAAADGTQPDAPWGLDRIDQRQLPLSTTYTYRTTAPDVSVYVIDTGLRTTHREFGGRASVGIDTVNDGQNGNDCHGHGTHVGGVAAGSTYGVAKEAELVAVRVLNCQGSGTTSGVVAGIEWVTAKAAKPAVANMSLGGGASDVLDRAVRNSIRSGVTYAVSAGSSGQPGGACSASPARLPEAITVAGSDRSDRVMSSSNTGKCVSLYAPGAQIPSAWRDSDTATATLSGTSMATAHASGAAALHLGFRPGDTPAQVKKGLVDNATGGVLQGPVPVVPDKLLYTLYLPWPVSAEGALLLTSGQ
ncbi:S8 family peptidase [Streptomyces flavofungini]|uniref:S8 family peptidase n=1 Tax=Streptomyces flavofungini TaxID=68200 RepID=UPI0025B00317|nr:S8 family peptidase [Streptomyces flavofungini]WJV44474.1 S8 family peptidase [Streptomyces flavofungini]